MSDPLLRALDHYVVLEPAGEERILSAADTVAWLEQRLDQLEALPRDLQACGSLADAARRLLETSCELEVSPGCCVQWFAVRIEPPER
ncbi:MAG: chlororespiratory reduction protein 7 [Aphanocapsa feldmannii 277cV]|uniref:Chlororespiratory reduction protein 7 n=2 Tax=Aphanocapsa feldmannii TaxID=192050 RepID=A0A524RQ69_9CHRO|nr:MAG: chlororespiratory reduction protein 7 [Aphanocapsa feldmannii 288cV]TGG94519.1 MAG: chlororespiratory reduction protein 7 [Aphanocapsa feldmannii 277cV]TGH25072.1 MAG: chlororespiratory reduction protein 7 [Aphanocapsa feldmannii 277cI]